MNLECVDLPRDSVSVFALVKAFLYQILTSYLVTAAVMFTDRKQAQSFDLSNNTDE